MFNSTQEIIQDISEGKMVIIVDEEDRENEGDLVMAAQFATSEHINFMAKYARGLICLSLTQKRCEELKLPLMGSGLGFTKEHEEKGFHHTNFTLSIDSKNVISTGISAKDRAITIQEAINPNKSADDFVHGGHIFPLMAKAGGVLTRAGHTEAGCDIARLAQLNESAVIVEIMNEDGTMARRDDLLIFAQKHQLKIGTIADLVKYRLKNEINVRRIDNKKFKVENSKYRLVCYEDVVFNRYHFAYVKGNITKNTPTYVRVHVKNTIHELTHIFSHNHMTIAKAFEIFDEKENAIIVILREQSEEKLTASLMGKNEKVFADDVKTYGIGAQILADLGVGKMIVLGSERPMQSLKGFSLEVIEYLTDR